MGRYRITSGHWLEKFVVYTVLLTIYQNVRAAKTTMLVVSILLVCYLPLIIKWQVRINIDMF